MGKLAFFKQFHGVGSETRGTPPSSGGWSKHRILLLEGREVVDKDPRIHIDSHATPLEAGSRVLLR
jgi:hypothetical protein